MKPSPFRIAAVVGITLLSIALGGSTQLWAQAIIVLLTAILILLSPPRLAPGIVPAVTLLLFLALAFSAFLPAGWGPLPEWRHHLAVDLHAVLGDLRTPQPWLTFQWCGILFFGLVWTSYLLAQEWSPSDKSLALRLLLAGVILLAAISTAAYLSGLRIPGWNEEENRGWFPNRNQTADVLALSGIMTYACAFKTLGKKKWTGLLWLAGLVPLGAALVISYSRAGILIFFAGIAFWHIGSLFRPRAGKSLAFGLSALLLLLSLFLLFGGTTLDRFMNSSPTERPAATPEYRTLIQEDALRVSLQAPLFGIGLGNFEPVFTSMRQASADQNRTIHPESDWLWVAVEMGWIAPLLILVGLGWWLRQCLPFTHSPGESIRRAAFIAFVLFIVHGFVDVSGHRIGSLLVGLLLARLALPSTGKKSALIAPLFRGLALILLLLGGWWLASINADLGPPTTATLSRLESRLDEAVAEGRIASAGEAANTALEIEPLRWNLYFHRARAEAFRTGAADQAANDFQIARFLEPNWIELTLNEGEIWLATDQPDRCVEAWRDTLRRAGPRGNEFYAAMLQLAQNNPEVHRGLRESASLSTDHLITFLGSASPDEAREELAALLTRDPSLKTFTLSQQRKLFSAWYGRGDQDQLANALVEHPDWQAAGWSFLARHYADRQDFQTAILTALKFIPAPPAIQPLPAASLTGISESHFDLHPDNAAEGVFLCQSQIAANRIDAALGTMAKLEKLNDCPRYIFYMEAQLHVKKQEWEQAWYALQRYTAI